MKTENNQSTIICLTPIKNEAWILHRFLKCASLWADHIIIADQGSTDSSRDIALSYPKVTLIENNSSEFNESERQQLLINAARKIPGPRLLISLDADEMLTANILDSAEFQTMLSAPPGTVFQFHCVNIKPDVKSCWIPSTYFPWGIMDDGTEHTGSMIHSTRIPIPLSSTKINLNEIKVLHYQYTDWLRMQSKHRWYQCFERINDPSKSAILLFRQYHHMHEIINNQQYLKKEWLTGYQKKGIDMTSTQEDKNYWWDSDVTLWLNQYGERFFKKEAIWGIHYKQKNRKDPRFLIDKVVHSYLEKSQKYYNVPILKLFFRPIDAILKRLY